MARPTLTLSDLQRVRAGDTIIQHTGGPGSIGNTPAQTAEYVVTEVYPIRPSVGGTHKLDFRASPADCDRIVWFGMIYEGMPRAWVRFADEAFLSIAAE